MCMISVIFYLTRPVYLQILTAWWSVERSMMKLRCGRQGIGELNCQSLIFPFTLISSNITNLEEFHI